MDLKAEKCSLKKKKEKNWTSAINEISIFSYFGINTHARACGVSYGIPIPPAPVIKQYTRHELHFLYFMTKK